MFHVKENTEASTTTATHDRNGPSCILVDRILSIVVVFSFVVVVIVVVIIFVVVIFFVVIDLLLFL